MRNIAHFATYAQFTATFKLGDFLMIKLNAMASWYEMLKEEFEVRGDNFENMITTLNEEELIEKIKIKAFTAWGEKYVYFPVCADGYNDIGSAPRNPCLEATPQVG